MSRPTNREIFRTAWLMAKAAAHEFNNSHPEKATSREFFSESLKCVYRSIKSNKPATTFYITCDWIENTFKASNFVELINQLWMLPATSVNRLLMDKHSKGELKRADKLSMHLAFYIVAIAY